MSLFIGIDSGTQSVKAVVLDLETNQVVAEARAPHALINGLPTGHLEQHPEEWTAAMDGVIKEVVSRIDRTRVRGIGVSGQQHGFVPLDAEGKVIRPAKLWCDTSTARECELLTRALGGSKAVIRKLGVAFLPGFTAPKILWLKRHEPANFRRLRQVLLPHDYLNYHLTGTYSMEPGDASGTALLDVRKRKWSRAAIDAVDRNLSDWLPDLGDSGGLAGHLQPARARAYGLSSNVIVSAGGGDNMMGAIGTGNVVPGVVTASFGTSGTIYAYASKPVVDPDGEIAAFCSSTGGWLPLLCTMNVTSVTEQMRGLFDFDHEALNAAVSAAPPGSDGLVMLPYLNGERTPNLPNASGVIFGLNSRNLDSGRLARASMEGVTLGMNYGLRRLSALGVKAKEMRVTGGGSRSAIWRQIMADVFGVPVVAMQEDEGAALGAAIQAAWACQRQEQSQTKLTAFTERAVVVNEASRCYPDRARVRSYRHLQELQDELSRAVRSVFDIHRKRGF